MLVSYCKESVLTFIHNNLKEIYIYFESAAVLKRSMTVYRDKIDYKTIDKSFVCHICRKTCRSEVSPLQPHNPKLEQWPSSAKKRQSLYVCIHRKCIRYRKHKKTIKYSTFSAIKLKKNIICPHHNWLCIFAYDEQLPVHVHLECGL